MLFRSIGLKKRCCGTGIAQKHACPVECCVNGNNYEEKKCSSAGGYTMGCKETVAGEQKGTCQVVTTA